MKFAFFENCKVRPVKSVESLPNYVAREGSSRSLRTLLPTPS
jgi:hypothetical protein